MCQTPKGFDPCLDLISGYLCRSIRSMVRLRAPPPAMIQLCGVFGSCGTMLAMASTVNAVSVAAPSAADIMFGSTGPRGGRRPGLAEAAANSAMRSIGSAVGREIIRGVLGSILGGGRRR